MAESLKRFLRPNALIAEVRRRDGDQCRFCLGLVDFLDRKSGDGGVFMHLDQSQPKGVENLVVACRECARELEARRIDTPVPGAAPTSPVYRRPTSDFIARYIGSLADEPAAVIEDQPRVDVEGRDEFGNPARHRCADVRVFEECPDLGAAGEPVLLQVRIDLVLSAGASVSIQAAPTTEGGPRG